MCISRQTVIQNLNQLQKNKRALNFSQATLKIVPLSTLSSSNFMFFSHFSSWMLFIFVFSRVITKLRFLRYISLNSYLSGLGHQKHEKSVSSFFFSLNYLSLIVLHCINIFPVTFASSSDEPFYIHLSLLFFFFRSLNILSISNMHFKTECFVWQVFELVLLSHHPFPPLHFQFYICACSITVINFGVSSL